MTTPPDPIDTALVVARALDALGVMHTVGGSIASSFAGEPQSTVDVDIVAALEERHVESLVSALSAEFYVDTDALRRAVRMRTSRPPSGFLRRRARRGGVADGRGGAVAIIQRFGAALSLNIHVHALVLDGVFAEDGGGHLRFHPV